MGFIFRFLFKLISYFLGVAILFAVCIFFLALWGAPKFLPGVLDKWVQGKSGFSLSIDTLELKPFVGEFHTTGVSLKNPRDYQASNCLNVDQVYCKIQPLTLVKDELIVDKLVVNIKDLSYVQNAHGSINFLELKHSFAPEKKRKKINGQSASISSSSKGPENPKKKYLIKKLVVSIDSFNIIGIPTPTERHTIEINFSKEFNDIRDISQITKLIEKELKNVAKDILTQGLIKGAAKALLEENVNIVVKPSVKAVEKIGDAVQKGINKVFDGLKK